MSEINKELEPSPSYVERVKLSELIKDLELQKYIGNEETISNKWIYSRKVNRGGLELNGFFLEKGPMPHSIMLFGKKESSFLETLTKEEAIKRIDRCIKNGFDTFIISKQFKVHNLFKELNYDNLIVLRCNSDTSLISYNLINFLGTHLLPKLEIHGTLLEIFGCGTLLLGKSGIGKSETALSLIKSGHSFIGDDRIIISHFNNILTGKIHPIIANLLEVRGIGLINITECFGVSSVKQTTKIDLVIHLYDDPKGIVVDRLKNTSTINYLGIELTKINIPVKPGNNIAVLVEAAVMSFLSNKKSDPLKLYNKQLKSYLKQNND